MLLVGAPNESGTSAVANVGDVAARLCELFEAASQGPDGGIRVEDLLSAAAAVCGEVCIVAAGEFDPESHDFAPGSPVLSDRMNTILMADATEWAGAGESVFGIIRAGCLANGYQEEDFPGLVDPLRGYAATLGSVTPADWGRVQLTVPEDNVPMLPPLARAFELRPFVREVLAANRLGEAEWPRVCALALVVELGRVRSAIAPGTAVRIVLETVNGLAKMAPMTIRHMQQALGTSEPPAKRQGLFRGWRKRPRPAQ